MIGHVSRHELMAYAEGLVDHRAAFARSVAQHIHACAQCAAEVTSIRRSLEAVAAVPELEPSPASAEEILLAARRIRQSGDAGTPMRRGRWLSGALKGIGYAAALAVIVGTAFHAAIADPDPAAPAGSLIPAALAATPKAADDATLQTATAQVQTLVTALTARPETAGRSEPDQARLRAVMRLDADIREAMTALEKNPACERAQQLVDANRRRQAETLRRLFVERNL